MNYIGKSDEEIKIQETHGIDARTEDARKVVQLQHKSNSNTEDVSDLAQSIT